MYPHLYEAHEELKEQFQELLRECEALEEALDKTTQYLQIVFNRIPIQTADEILEEYPEIRGVLA